MFQKNLIFEIPKEKILNSNQQKSHFMIHANIAAYLKKMGYDQGYENLPETQKAAITKRKELLDLEDNNKVIKSRITKRIKKENPGITTKELNELVLNEYEEAKISSEIKSNDIKFEPLFHHFTVKVLVTPPTARRLDPPNLWPTVKPLIDGLTYCGYWEDDDWEHLQEISFAYDETKEKNKGYFILELIITEKGDNK